MKAAVALNDGLRVVVAEEFLKDQMPLAAIENDPIVQLKNI